jgi:hypothetical protein
MDLVVTVPQKLWAKWILEGDPVGAPTSGEEWAFQVATKPPILPGERLYVVAWGLLRGFSPVTRVFQTDRGWAICRRGDAVACTLNRVIPGFRGYRARWWDQKEEVPFPEWKTKDIGASQFGELQWDSLKHGISM